MDIAGLIHGANGFVATLGPRVVRSGPDGVETAVMTAQALERYAPP